MKNEFTRLGDGIAEIGIITTKKYNHLKRFENTLNDSELKMLKDYETYKLNSKIEDMERNAKLVKPIVENPKIENLRGDYVFKYFVEFWKTVHKKELILNENNKKIIFSLCQYFGNDESCPLNLKKGILLSGNCGVGKSSMMHVFHVMGKTLLQKKNSNLMWFQSINCNDLVEEFESSETDASQFHKKYKTGNKHFEDFGTERMASKFGKSNLMQEVLEKRYLNLDFKTYMCTNLTPKEIGEKYGFRVFDRIFEQFNYIEMKGESFRRI